MVTVGSPVRSAAATSSVRNGTVSWACRSRLSIRRTRSPSSAAALRVNVSPSTPVRLDQPVGDQPDHPQAHRLGLAGAGSGDDDVRAQRRRDRRRPAPASAGATPRAGARARPASAARRGRGAGSNRLGWSRPVRAGVMPVTARPSSCTGQLVRTGHMPQ